MTIDESPPLITAVVGESGSGKTTLARLLLGLETPTEGDVLFRGTDIATMDKSTRRHFLQDVQFVFQDPYGVYNPFYKVDHVLTKAISKFKLASSRQEARELINTALETVGLRPRRDAGALPPRNERWPAATGHGGAGAAAQAALDHRRRAGFDGRCLATGDDPRQLARTERKIWHLDHLHYPRPRHRLPDQPQHDRALSRCGE